MTVHLHTTLYWDDPGFTKWKPYHPHTARFFDPQPNRESKKYMGNSKIAPILPDYTQATNLLAKILAITAKCPKQAADGRTKNGRNQ